MEKDKTGSGESEITLQERDISNDAAVAEDERGLEQAAKDLDNLEVEKDKTAESPDTETEEVEEIDFDALADELQLDKNRSVKEYFQDAKTATELKAKIDNLLPMLNDLGFLDLDDFTKRLPGLLNQKEQPGEQARPAEAQDLSKIFSGYDETSQKFGKAIIEHILNHPNFSGLDKKFSGVTEGAYETLTELWYDRLERKLEKEGQPLDLNLRQLRLVLDSLGDKAIASAKAAGKNPLEVAYRYYQTERGGQKPATKPVTNGKPSGIDQAKNLEKPGVVKQAEKFPVNPKDWDEEKWAQYYRKNPQAAMELLNRTK